MIINNSEFRIKEYPTFHPVIDKFDRLDWWKEHKPKIFEGCWVGGKWMPPELYYYINFHNIIVEDGIYRRLSLPWLRDIDWLFFLTYTEAIGFSGFELDEKYTCHRGFKSYKDGKITKEEFIRDYCTNSITKKIDKEVYNSVFSPDGSDKIFMPASDYLKKIHDKQLGKPLYFNPAKHILVLGARGFGKSFNSSGLICHNFITDGIKDYELWIKQRNDLKPMKSETVVGAIDSKYSDDLLNKVKAAFENYYDSHAIRNGNEYLKWPSPLYSSYTGSLMSGKSITAEKSKSQIHHRTFQDNPLSANGTRPNRVFIDEIGFMNNLLETWEALESSQAGAEFKRLTIVGMGTGGLTSGGAAMYTHEMFYSPEEYGCLAFEDIWEGKGKIGYFVPGSYAKNQYKEGQNYITNEARAIADIEALREEAKKAPTRTKLMGTIINLPLVPSEIFLRMEGTFFPIQDLKIRMAELESVNSLLSATYKYDMNLKDGFPVPGLSEKPVIREFPLRKGFDMDGCVEVFELPKKDVNGRVFSNRYIAGWDPVVNDGNEDTNRSLQSMFIFDLWTERIVAEYTARTYLSEDYYEQARRLLIYYSAVCNYESNIKGPYAYFKNKNSLHLLVETPEILKDQNLIKAGTGVGNKSLGTTTNDAIINWGLGLILSWLEAPAYEREENVRNMDLILSLGLIKELISYSKDINTDRVSALIMVMILKSDRQRITEMARASSTKTKGQDKFWDKAFGMQNKRRIISL